MSHRGGPPIDFEAWARNQVAKRTKAALEERDAAFAAQHAETPLSELAQYLIRCARSLGHSPSPAEIDGGAYIEARFGDWAAAMAAARLPMPVSLRKVNETARYKAERVRQEPLFRAERKQKKQLKHERAEQRRHEQAVKRRAERAAAAEREAGKGSPPSGGAERERERDAARREKETIT